MTRYASQQAYETALADPNSFENRMSGSIPPTQSPPPTQSSPFEGLSQLFATRSQMNQGIGSFKNILGPIIESVQKQSQEELSEKITPYIQRVEQLTQETFPNIDFNMLNGFGGGPKLGGGLLFPPGGMPSGSLTKGQNQLGVPVGDPLHNLNTTSSPERSGSINSPFARSILSQGLGSFLR